MVDWGKIGKQALDLSKKAGEKGMESFNDWRTDEARIQRVQEKKEIKKEKKTKRITHLCVLNTLSTTKLKVYSNL